MICKQCGYDHTGWTFDEGYDRLCVRCGSPLPTSAEPDATPGPATLGPGAFRRVLDRVLRRRGPPPVPEAQFQASWVPREPFVPPPQGTPGNRGSHQEPAQAPLPAAEPEKTIPREAAISVPHDASITLPREAAISVPRETVISASADHPAQEQPEQETAPGVAHIHGEEGSQVQSPPLAGFAACKESVRLLAEEGRYEEALDELQNAIDRMPDDPEPWGEMGRVHLQALKDIPKAIECFRRALSLNHGLIRVQGQLSLALLLNGQLQEAKKSYLNTIRLIRNGGAPELGSGDNGKGVLSECLKDLRAARGQSAGSLLGEITSMIELLELEKIYFH
jgi:hypothetical protein